MREYKHHIDITKSRRDDFCREDIRPWEYDEIWPCSRAICPAEKMPLIAEGMQATVLTLS